MTQLIPCSICKDKGFTRIAGGYQECKCLVEKKLKRRLLDAGIKEVFINFCLEDWKFPGPPNEFHPIMTGALNKIFSGGFLNKPLCFYGPRNSGKSLFASMLVGSAVRGGRNAMIMGLGGLSDIYFGKDSRYERIDDLIRPIQVFCLEIGQEFYAKIMGHLICSVHRHFRESGKVLIYTTPYSREDMGRVYGKEVEGVFGSSAGEVVYVSTKEGL